MTRLSVICLAAVFGFAMPGCQKKDAAKKPEASAGQDKKALAAKDKKAPAGKDAKAKDKTPAKADAKASAKPAAAAAAAAVAKPAAGAPAANVKFPGGDKPAHLRMLAILEGMAKIFEADGADCDKLAKSLGAFGNEKQKELAELKGMIESYTPEQKKAAEATMKTRMMGVLPKIMGGAMKCQKNPAFLEAMKKLKVQ